MKKLFSLFVPLMALFLTPQTAKADYVDDNLTQPLTIEMPTDGVTASFKIYFAGATSSGSSTKVTTNLQYRLSSNGGAWGAWTNVLVSGTTKYSSVAGAAPTAVTLGGGSSPYKKWKVQLRGVNPEGFSKSSSYYFSISLESGSSGSRNITVSGNVMSLIVGYDSDNPAAAQAALAAADEIPCDYCFYRLFHYISSISNVMTIDASNLIFPATKLKNSCYQDLFYDAKSSTSYGLTAGPTFLATDFVDKTNTKVSSSFAGLCQGCKKLTSIHVNFRNCYAAGENNLTNWLKTGATSPYPTLYAPEAFRTCAVNNSGLSDGVWGNWTKTEWSKDMGPSTHTVTISTPSNGTLTVMDGLTTVSNGDAVAHGTTLTLTATPATGYHFSSWTNDAAASVTVNSDVTLGVTFAPNTYQVSFDAGEGSGAAMANQNFTYGVAQNLTANTYTGPAATVTYDATGGDNPASETVYATFQNWRKDAVTTYTDEQSVSNLTATNNDVVALTAEWEFTYEDATVILPSPTRTGYTFDYWEKHDGMGVFEEGGAGEEYFFDEDITLYAHWTAVTYNLTYEGLNGASNSNPATYTIETATITLADPGTRTGYTFTGWTCGGEAITQITVGSTGNKTITANWMLNTDVVLPDNTDNSDLLAIYNGQTANVTIGRTFYADGKWGTVCLPFNLSIAGTAFDGAEVRTMSDAYIYNKGSENEKLIIECDEATSTTTLTAGRPYIIRFAEGDNIVNPTFNGVTISVTSAGNVEGTDLNFIGLLAPRALATDGSNLFLGGNNTLYKPSPSSATVNAFRAYFGYKDVLPQYPRRSMMVFDKGAQMPTDVEIVTPEDKPLDGKRIENGQLVIYRNGMRYNVAGQLLD